MTKRTLRKPLNKQFGDNQITMEIAKLIAIYQADISDFSNKTAKVEKGLKDVGETAERTGSKVDALGKQSASAFSQATSAMSSFGQGMQSLGSFMTAALSAPIAALGIFSAKSAISIDALRNKMIAATGDVASANLKIKELRDLAQSSAGVFSNMAADLYAFFKPMKADDNAINTIIKAMGRLKLANEELDTKEFGRNLTQLFTQGFEMQDLKQAVGAFPRLGEILQKQFNLEGSDLDSIKAGLNKLKAEGKLTLNDFLKGFADGVNSDSSLSKLTDTVGIRMEKMKERIFIALEPIGTMFLNVFEKVGAFVTPIIERISAAFTNLSPVGQMIAGIFAGVAAAVGPVLAVIGSVIVAVGGVVSAIGTIAGAIAAIGGVGPVLAIVGGALAQVAVVAGATGAAAFALYQAWQTNFGGIRDLTAIVGKTVTDLWNGAMEQISALTSAVLAQLTQFWRENGEDIKLAVTNVGNAIRSYWQMILGNINSFWSAHGAEIKQIASVVWSHVKVVVTNGLQIILGVVKTVAGVINGDWRGAWDGAKQIFSSAWNIIISAARSSVEIVISVFKGLVKFIFNAGVEAYNAAWNLGTNIGKGLYNGIMNWENSIRDAVKYLTNIGTSGMKTVGASLGAQFEGQLSLAGAGASLGGLVDKAITANRPTGGAGGRPSGGGRGASGGSGGDKGTPQKSAFTQLLEQLNKEIMLNSALTREQKLGVDLLDDSYKKLNATQREMLLSKARILDVQEAEKSSIDKLKDGFNALTEQFAPVKWAMDSFNELISNSVAVEKFAASIGKTADEVIRLGRSFAEKSDILKTFELISQGAPKAGNWLEQMIGQKDFLPKPQGQVVQIFDWGIEPEKEKGIWSTITDSFGEGLKRLQQSLPPLKQQLSDIFLDLPMRATDVLGNALQNWDGTFKGFFKSIGQSFGQLITELINELLRMVVVQAIMKVVGGMFGNVGNTVSASAGGLSTSGSLMTKFIALRKAQGGLIQGAGTKTSDSIMAMLSNGEFVMKADAVNKFGAGFFASLNNLQLPAFSGGGMVANSGMSFDEPFVPTFERQVNNKTENNRTVNNTVHIHAKQSPSLATPKSRRQTAEAMASALRRYQ